MINKIIFATLLMATVLVGCIKPTDPLFTENIAELDVASYNANFGSQPFYFTTRQPLPGRAVLSADAFIARTASVASFRVNMTGSQKTTPIKVKYQTFIVGPANVNTNVAYGAPISATLTAIDAVAGTHYGTVSGVCTIPPNSSFGTIDIPIINSGVSSLQTAILGIELLNGGDIKVSENYKKVAFAISQK
jgi:hypothetical protein